MKKCAGGAQQRFALKRGLHARAGVKRDRKTRRAEFADVRSEENLDFKLGSPTNECERCAKCDEMKWNCAEALLVALKNKTTCGKQTVLN